MYYRFLVPRYENQHWILSSQVREPSLDSEFPGAGTRHGFWVPWYGNPHHVLDSQMRNSKLTSLNREAVHRSKAAIDWSTDYRYEDVKLNFRYERADITVCLLDDNKTIQTCTHAPLTSRTVMELILFELFRNLNHIRSFHLKSK